MDKNNSWFDFKAPFKRLYQMVLRVLAGNLIAEYEKSIEERDGTIARLRESDTLFKRITGHTSALVSIHDAHGRYVYAGHSHSRMGYRREQLIGKSTLTMVAPEERAAVTAAMEAAKGGRKTDSFFNYSLRDKSGSVRYYRGAFDAVFGPSGDLDQLICVSEDITELRRAQAEKVAALTEAAESQKMALVGQVAGKMAHDFNNILTIIMGIAEVNAIENHDPQAKKAFSQIFRQSLLGKSMTKNLVAFAKDQELKQEIFSLGDKIDLVLDLLGKELDGIKVARNFQGRGDLVNADLVNADPGMIENALINVIQNAIHALDRIPAPRIHIATRIKKSDDAKDAGRICIEIQDNGCGIPDKYKDLIFEPSFTLKGARDRSEAYAKEIQGSGYGMANVKKCVSQHQGEVAVWSREGEGTRISIELPAAGGSPGQRAAKPEEAAVIGASGKRILIVEDEPAISGIHRNLLANGPGRHKVDVAETGEAALALLKKEQYDLVSLDYVLPGGLDGMDVYTRIRETDPELPILFVSGNLGFIASVEALKPKDPCLASLSKPFTNLEYFNRVNRLLPPA